MDTDPQQQMELERLDNLIRIFEKVERACGDGYLFTREVQDLKFECGLTNKEIQHAMER